jgi:hypothetical protein
MSLMMWLRRGKKCRSANHYDTEADANKAARRYEKRDAWKFRSYECDECGEWHIAKARKDGIPIILIEYL